MIPLAQQELIVMDMETAFAELGMVVRSALDVLLDIFNQIEGAMVRFNCIYTLYYFKVPPFFQIFQE